MWDSTQVSFTGYVEEHPRKEERTRTHTDTHGHTRTQTDTDGHTRTHTDTHLSPHLVLFAPYFTSHLSHRFRKSLKVHAWSYTEPSEHFQEMLSHWVRERGGKKRMSEISQLRCSQIRCVFTLAKSEREMVNNKPQLHQASHIRPHRISLPLPLCDEPWETSMVEAKA